MIRIEAKKVDASDVAAIIIKALPDQGSIEVQRDVPGKEHVWHTHAVDKTIVLLDGNLRFHWSDGDRLCSPGDVISLPAGTPHGSMALEKGATYLIAFHALGM